MSYIRGVDINRNQRGELEDADQIRAAEYEFAIVEVCWGLDRLPTFDEFWPPLVDAGVIVMGYGFFRGDRNGKDQADLLLNESRRMYEAQGFWMPLFSDVEEFAGDGATVAQRRGNWLRWVSMVRTIIRPGVYSSERYWRPMMNGLALPEDVLGWVANYSPTELPLIPTGWRRENTPLHQIGQALKHAWCPRVPGMRGDVSIDRFYGSRENLLGLGFFGEPIPEPDPVPDEEDEMAVREKLLQARALIDEALVELGSEPPGPPTPPPPGPVTATYLVTAEKSLANWAKDTNDAGRPAMEIYEPRVRYNEGDRVAVLPSIVAADGGSRWYEIYGLKGMAGEKLYLDKAKGTLV